MNAKVPEYFLYIGNEFVDQLSRVDATKYEILFLDLVEFMDEEISRIGSPRNKLHLACREIGRPCCCLHVRKISPHARWYSRMGDAAPALSKAWKSIAQRARI